MTDTLDLPEDDWRKVAHRAAKSHRVQVEASESCGCFYCLEVFPSSAIIDWIDERRGLSQTALCPFCHVDSVIPDNAGFDLTPAFLSAMHEAWFGGPWLRLFPPPPTDPP